MIAGNRGSASPGDPVTFVVVPLTLGAVVLLATYLPARRAVKTKSPFSSVTAERMSPFNS